MAKVVVKQPGFFVTLPKLGSFRSPFKVKVPDSLVPLVEAELLKSGVKDFKVFKDDFPIKKELVKKGAKEVKHPEQKDSVDMSEVIGRLKDIQSLVSKILSKDSIIREVIIQREESRPAIIKEPEIEEEIFIPRTSERISIIDLSVKTTEKEDVSNQVELLSSLKK